MIHEYAIAPSVLASWANDKRDFREFLREYGLGSPRILSTFPKAKVSKLKGYYLDNGPQDLDSLQGRRYFEMVTLISDALVKRPAPSCTNGSWEQMIASEHGNKPFNVIISDPVLALTGCVSPACMYDEGSSWSHERQASIPRTLTPAISLLKNFLRFSTEQVVFVDPYGWTTPACKTIQELLKATIQDRVNPNIPKVSLFFKKTNSSATVSIVKQRIMEGLDISDLDVKVFELEEIPGDDVFHNRCVLSEHGGAFSGHGFGLSNEPEHTDDWFLLERDIYEKKWMQFAEDGGFKVLSEA